MRFSCERCEAQYHIDDAKVGERGVKVRCKRCGNIIIVRKEEHDTVVVNIPEGEQPQKAEKQTTPSAKAPSEEEVADRFTTRVFNFEEMQIVLKEQRAAQARGEEPADLIEDEWAERTELGDDQPPVAAKQEIRPKKDSQVSTVMEPQEPVWYLAINNEQVGPLTISEVEDRWDRGEVNEDSLAWKAGFSDWREIRTISELLFLVKIPTKELRRRAGLISMSDLGISPERERPRERRFAQKARAQPRAEDHVTKPHVAPSSFPVVDVLGPSAEAEGSWKPSAGAALVSLTEKAAQQFPAEEKPPAPLVDEQLVIPSKRAAEPSAEILSPPPPVIKEEHEEFVTEDEVAAAPHIPRERKKERKEVLAEVELTKTDAAIARVAKTRRILLTVAAVTVVTFTGSAIYVKFINPPPVQKEAGKAEESASGSVKEASIKPTPPAPIEAQKEGRAVTSAGIKEGEKEAEIKETKKEKKIAAPTPAPKIAKEKKKKPKRIVKKKRKKRPKRIVKKRRPKRTALAVKKTPPRKKSRYTKPSRKTTRYTKKARHPKKTSRKKEEIIVKKGLSPQRTTRKVKKVKRAKPAKPAHRDDLLAFDKEFGDDTDDNFDSLLDSVSSKPKKKPRSAPKSTVQKVPPPPPPPERSALPTKLTPQQIKRVVVSKKMEIKQCVDEYKARGGAIQGRRLFVSWTILPNGTTTAVKVKSPEYRKSFLAGCVKSLIRHWKFPKFNGKPLPINFPFTIRK